MSRRTPVGPADLRDRLEIPLFSALAGRARAGPPLTAAPQPLILPGVTQQTDKTWQYGQTAATLLVAYLFVLQGLAAGLTIGARSGQSAFVNAICLSARSGATDDKSQSPRTGSHGLHACCVQHCSGFDEGVLGDTAAPTAPPLVFASALSPLRAFGHVSRRDILPVGARAPPSRDA
jgi:hypothetical protein